MVRLVVRSARMRSLLHNVLDYSESLGDFPDELGCKFGALQYQLHHNVLLLHK